MLKSQVEESDFVLTIEDWIPSPKKIDVLYFLLKRFELSLKVQNTSLKLIYARLLMNINVERLKRAH